MGKTNNLLGESFSDFVGEQIRVRQEVLGKYSNQNPSDLQYYTSKTAWLQLTSGVNITPEKAKSLNLPESYAKNKLASDFILKGGTEKGKIVISNNIDNFNEDLTLEKRGGILSNYNNAFLSDTAYGLASTKDFGLSPMPGLLGAEIKSLNRGSLKEASVKIKCFNKFQFDIIDTLFLKLKYPVLLEWGHSLYLDKNKTIQKNIYTIANTFLGNNPNKPTPSQDDIYSEIDKNRENFEGNYDGILAYVKNFNWSLNTDGSYDITLSLISIGEIVESIKFSLRDTTSPEIGEGKKNRNSLESFFLFWEKKITEELGFWEKYFYEKNYVSKLKITSEDFKEFFKKQTISLRLDPSQSPPNEYVRLDFNQIGTEGEGNVGTNHYFTLGFLLRFIESYLLYYDDKKKKPIFNIFTDYDENYCFTFDQHTSIDPRICLIPINPTRKVYRFKLYKLSDKGEKIYVNAEGNKVDYGGKAYTSSQSNILSQAQSKNLNIEIVEDNQFTEEATLTNKDIKKLNEYVNGFRKPSYKNIGYLMHIRVNFDYVRKIFDNSYQGEEFSLYDFLTSLMKGIQKALGNVNDFEVICDPEINTFKIIDNTYIPGVKDFIPDIKKDPYKINVNTLKDNFGSFVKEVSISSEITKELATELTIAATSNSQNSNQTGVNGSRFSHLNAGCENRILILSDNFSNKEDDLGNDEDTGSPTRDPEEIFGENLIKFNKFIDDLFVRVNGGIGRLKEDEISNYAELANQYFNYLLGKEESSPKGASYNGRGFIPINLSLTMDGLSGIRIYEKFTINQEYLPQNYQNTLDFLVKGISHNIDNNGWEIKLETLGIPKISEDMSSKNIIITTSPPIPQSNSSTSQPVGVCGQKVINPIPTAIEPLSFIRRTAIGKSFNSVFTTFGEIKGMCAQWTYNLALNYIRSIRGQLPIPGIKLNAGGNANQNNEFFNNLVKLGYTKTIAYKNIDKQTLSQLTRGNNISWALGDVLVYYANDGDRQLSHVKYGHAQIYVGDLTPSKWASSVKNNYGNSFIYGSRNSNCWDVIIFRAPLS
jgi:hypothetical protein